MLEIFCIWLLFGIVSELIYPNKGLSFLLGFLLGVFGLIIVLILKSNKEEEK